MNELKAGCRMEGSVLIDGEDIYHPSRDPVALRKRVGMVFAMPMPLPLTIYDNVAYGPRLATGAVARIAKRFASLRRRRRPSWTSWSSRASSRPSSGTR